MSIGMEVSPKEIKEYLDKFNDWLKKSKWKRIKKEMSEARADKNLYDFLQWLYPSENIPVINGFRYPVALYPAPKIQWDNPESVLIKAGWHLPEIVHPALKKAGEKYRKLRMAVGAEMWNDDIYRMLKLENRNQLKMYCGVGKYFTAFETCDVLELELLTKFAENHPRSKDDFNWFFQNELKLRRLVHNSIKEPSGISAAIGVSTLIIFRHEDHLKTILWERSEIVGSHGSLIHVVPSFMFQPVIGDFDDEFSVKHNVYREYLEELFDVPIAKKPERQISPFYFYEHPNLKFLRRLEKEKKARLLFTGVAINLLNLRPEICTLLLINTNEWYDKHSSGDMSTGLTILKVNEEFKPITEGKHVRVVLEIKDDLSFPMRNELSPSKMVPPGAAALILGLDVARQILNEENNK
jgi:hypothetical protein